MKKMFTGDVKKEDKKMDNSDGILYRPLCPDDISKIYSLNSLHARSFNAYDMTKAFKRELHVRAYVDYYGGYAEHARNVIFRLQDTGKYNIKLMVVPTPIDIDPIVWQKCNFFSNNHIDVEKSNYMVIAGPGHFQERLLPKNPARKVIGWTMIESERYSYECAKWIRNANYILCPTKTDVERAMYAGVSNAVNMRLGFDELLFNPEVEAIDINGLQGRFVFGVLGSWNIRKGIKEIIKAYCKAFDSKSNTTLLLCCKYGNRKYGEEKDNDERWTIRYEFNKMLEEIPRSKETLPHIALIDIPVHECVVPAIMARFNCLVGFSSGESTWLPGIQAMGMKIPIIQLSNHCCGYMEYLNDENSFLCKKTRYEKASEEFWKTTSEYYEDQVFGFGDVNELADNMHNVKNKVESCQVENMLENAYIESKNWTWNKSINKLDEFLSSI